MSMVKNPTQIVASPAHRVVPASGQTRRTAEFRERKTLENTTRWEIYTPKSVRDQVREIAKKDRISMGVAAVTLLKLGLEAYLTTNESALAENNLNRTPESAASTVAAQVLATHPVSVKDDVMSPGDAKSGSERSVAFNSMENTPPTNDPIHAELGIEDTAVKQIPEVAMMITHGSHVANIRDGPVIPQTGSQQSSEVTTPTDGQTFVDDIREVCPKDTMPVVVKPQDGESPKVDVPATGNTFADFTSGATKRT